MRRPSASKLITAAGAAVALMLLAASGPASAAMAGGADVTTEETELAARNAATVRRAFEEWAAGDNVFASLLADDVVWVIHGSGPVARTYRGLDDFVEHASRPLTTRLATPIVPEVHQIWADGDTVVVRFDGSATTNAGMPYRNQFVWIFKMNNDRVIRAEAFLDLVAYQDVVDHNEPSP